MRWQAKAGLISLSLVSMIAGAQSPAPLPVVATLVQKAILQQRIAESKERDYVFREDTNDIRLPKSCTWAPVCNGFYVLRYTEHHFEIFWLDGVRVARVLPSCDDCISGLGPVKSLITNIPISEKELAAENQRVEREVAEAKALRAQGEDPSSPDDPPQILLSRMLELCTFSNPRRKVIDGRPTILLDFAWNPSEKLVGANEALLKHFSGTVGIDEEDHAVQHVKGRFLANVKLDEGKIKIHKGTQITITNRRVDKGIWLLSRLDAWGEGHFFEFAINGAGHIFVGKYRKFRATTKILSGSLLAKDRGRDSVSRKEMQANEVQKLPQEEAYETLTRKTQARGYWVAPSTGLMWAAEDNGKPVAWPQAMQYCRDLRLAGHSDWRLPTIDELKGLIDKKAYTPRQIGNLDLNFDLDLHVKGGLLVTTRGEWSSSPRLDIKGYRTGYMWFINFVFGRAAIAPTDSSGGKRALCVRNTRTAPPPSSNGTVNVVAKSPTRNQNSAKEAQLPDDWTDPSTGLLWMAQDNGQNVNWHQAMKFCRNLRLAGYSDWRLPTINELNGIYDANAYAFPTSKGMVSVHDGRAKGGLFLTGSDYWSSSRMKYGFAWLFDFSRGIRDHQPLGYSGGDHALCVRRAGG